VSNGLPIKSVGFVGLGRMGLAMAKRVAAAGFDVTGHDPDGDAGARAAMAGIATVDSPAGLARASDFIVVVVGFEHQVEASLFGDGGAAGSMRPGTVVGIASTVAPRFLQGIAGRLGALGLDVLDMPVARGEAAAAAGDLLVFAGGDGETLERCRPVLGSFAGEIAHLGPAGTGQVAKAVNNMLLWTCLSANVEAFAFAGAFGIDREALRAALAHSSGANWALRTRADERPALWAEKDMMILLAEADRARVAMPVAGTVKEAIKAFKIARGLPMPEEGG
jgi:3-hydroxyisobutyrate dehydrogenase-like beta-hydroxyacid dehydrogenase